MRKVHDPASPVSVDHADRSGPDVRFRILGPLELVHDGVRMRLGNSREQKVLAGLLLDVNRVVPLARLIEAIWDDRPPRTAVKAIRNCVSTLRRRLADAGAPGGLVTTEPTGYLLQVEEGQVDARVFERQVSQGRQMASDGRLQAAVGRLREALALWRGPALADVSGPVIEAGAARLNERRLAAQEECLSYELSLGRDQELVDELATLVATQPLRERLSGLLMLALYRGGRRADALEAYRHARCRLVEELAIEPGPELAALHQAILADDPRLMVGKATGGAAAPPIWIALPLPLPLPLSSPATTQWSAESVPQQPSHARGAGPAPLAPTPAQLPASASPLVGRERQLRELDALLPPLDQDRPQLTTMTIATLTGTAGVGKTALAIHWARRASRHFPDGQLHVNLRGFEPGGQVMAPAEAIRGFLDALGVPPERVPARIEVQAALYRSLLADKRVLILLDNARDAAQVRPLLPGAPTCLVIVTSRDQLIPLIAADGARPLILDVLSPTGARELLASRIGADRVLAEPEAADEIITSCARLPLAMTIAAARAQMTGCQLSALAAELGAARARLDALDAGDRTAEVRAALSWSYATLSPTAARLFRLLGLHPGPDISTAAAASLAGRDPAQARRTLAELTRANLLREHVLGRYACHDLLRAYAAELASTTEPDPARHAAVIRLYDHYVHTAHAADRLMQPSREPIPLPLAQPAPGTTAERFADQQQAMAWLTAERPVLLGALRHAVAVSGTHAWQLAWALNTFLYRQGHWHDQVTAWQAALPVAVSLGDPTAQALAHRCLAAALIRLGHHADADTHLRLALDLYVRAEDRIGQAYTHQYFSGLYERQGRLEQALRHDEQALALHQAAGNRRGQAHALSVVGWGNALLGDYARAITCCEQALALHRQLGDRAGQGSTWDSLGYAHHHLGHHRVAADCYNRALAFFQQVGDLVGEADVLTHLGDTHHAGGDPDAARTAWARALRILEGLDHPDADGVRAKLAVDAERDHSHRPARS